MVCLKCYSKVEKFIGTKFETYAGFVCKRPWYFIVVPLVIDALLGIGFINLQSESNSERLFTPQNSQASKDRTTLQTIFDYSSSENFNSLSKLDAEAYGDIIFEAKQGNNILAEQYITEITSIVDSITSMTFSDTSGSMSNFSNICAVSNNECVIDGNIIFSASFKTSLQANSILYPGTGATSLQGIFGNIVVSGGILTHASYIKLRFQLKHESEDATKWFEAYINKLQTLSGNITSIFYAHSNSLDEELNANIGGDIIFFSLTFTLMIIYATSATTNNRCVSDRQNLAKAGVLGAALAILGSFGIVAGCGLEFVSIVATMPFLIIGIGVDDMFLLLSGLAETYDCKGPLEPEDRIKKTMRTSGVGITITSLTDLLAFLIGATSSFMSVRNFCVYTGVAVLFCYLNYITFFVGCMVIHERRVTSSLHCCTCRKISPKKTKPRKSILDGQPHSCMCTGSIPTTRNDVEGPLEKYPPRIISSIVLKKPVKCIILLLFAVYLGISIWGATKFEQGLVLRDLVTEDSYYFRYSEVNTKYYSSRFPISINIPHTLKYSDENTWSKISALQMNLQNAEGIVSDESVNWLESFRNSSFYINSSEVNFVTALRSNFLPANPRFVDDIKFDSLNTTIVASRFYIFSNNVDKSSEQGKLMLRIRELVSSSMIPNAIAFSPAFIFFEQYVAILPNTLQTLGIAVAAIFVVTIIFLPHPVLVLFVTLTLAMIIVGLFGFMYFWDLTLSSITMIHIIMSVGFSVDFSAHVCHGFMDAGKSDRNEGAKGALIRAGGPIFNGAISSIIGIIMLAFSNSFIFKSFFKVMLLIILFGAAHSLFFLPVVLSILGPSFSNERDNELALSTKEDKKKTDSSITDGNKSCKTDYTNKAYE